MKDSERLNLITEEMKIIQTKFDTFNDLVFRKRTWLTTIIVAIISASIVNEKPQLLLITIYLPPLFWIVEVLWRVTNVYKYVDRYNNIREHLDNGNIKELKIFDITNKTDRKKKYLFKAIKMATFRLESLIFYSLFLIIGIWINFQYFA